MPERTTKQRLSPVEITVNVFLCSGEIIGTRIHINNAKTTVIAVVLNMSFLVLNLYITNPITKITEHMTMPVISHFLCTGIVQKGMRDTSFATVDTRSSMNSVVSNSANESDLVSVEGIKDSAVARVPEIIP